MNKWLKKLRGILGTGAVWGTAGLSVGAFLGAGTILMARKAPDELPPWSGEDLTDRIGPPGPPRPGASKESQDSDPGS